MPSQPIPFVPNQTTGQAALAGAGQEAFNVVLERSGAVRRRPGIAASGLGGDASIDADGVSGLWVTKDDSKVFAVVGAAPSRSLVQVTAGGAFTEFAALNGAKRPVFAETEALLTVTTGNAPVKRVLTLPAPGGSLLSGAPQCTHIIANSSRLLTNNTPTDRGRISYSDVAIGAVYSGHETWTTGVGTAGFFSAEARPDPVVALYENTNEVFGFGSTNVQVFSPDSQTVYAPTATREYGCIAPYSVIKRDQAFAWLDDRRRIVISDGRSFEVVSQPIQQTLDDLPTVSDAFGYRVHLGPVDCLVWTFPTDGRTFAYQMGGGWSTWMGWDGNWSRFIVDAHHQRADTGTNLVGTTAGQVAQLSMAAQTDLGASLNAHVTTGYLNRDVDRRKRCQCVRLTLQRGQTTGSTEPVGRLEWRDDLGPWSGVDVSLGATGDTTNVVEYRSLGVYRRRQWRFLFSGSEELVLAAASEDFEVLEV